MQFYILDFDDFFFIRFTYEAKIFPFLPYRNIVDKTSIKFIKKS